MKITIVIAALMASAASHAASGPFAELKKCMDGFYGRRGETYHVDYARAGSTKTEDPFPNMGTMTISDSSALDSKNKPMTVSDAAKALGVTVSWEAHVRQDTNTNEAGHVDEVRARHEKAEGDALVKWLSSAGQEGVPVETGFGKALLAPKQQSLPAGRINYDRVHSLMRSIENRVADLKSCKSLNDPFMTKAAMRELGRLDQLHNDVLEVIPADDGATSPMPPAGARPMSVPVQQPAQ